jgi:hypothetical protein
VTPLIDEHRQLYRAYSQSYATEANRRRIAFWVDALFAAVATAIATLQALSTATPLLDFLAAWSPPAALLWLAIRETELLGDDKEQRRTAVAIQEQFDLTFWKNEAWRDAWNLLLCKRVQQRVINELALAYRGEPMRDDYWVDTRQIDPNPAALLRIEQSAGWGAKGHSRYARLNRVAAIAGILVMLVVATIADFRTRETVAMLFAVAPLLVGRLQSARDHAALARRREEVESAIQERLRSNSDVSDGDVRAAQDELCRLRLEHRRIPKWLYARHAEHDRKTIDAAVARDADAVRAMHAGA